MKNKDLYKLCLDTFRKSVEYTNSVTDLIDALSEQYDITPEVATLYVRNEQIKRDQEDILSPLKNKYQLWDW